MWGEVEAMPEAEFNAWMNEQRQGLPTQQDMAPLAGDPVLAGAGMAAEGRRLASAFGCTNCHTTDGTPHIGPTWLDLYRRRERLVTGEIVDADEAYLTESMMDPRAKIVAGFAPVMPTFQGRLDGPSAAAIVEYIKSLRTDAVPVPAKEPVYEHRP
jgi:cytochrome c oxidase subunit 2